MPLERQQVDCRERVSNPVLAVSEVGLQDFVRTTSPEPSNCQELSDLIAARRELVKRRNALRKTADELRPPSEAV